MPPGVFLVAQVNEVNSPFGVSIKALISKFGGDIFPMIFRMTRRL